MTEALTLARPYARAAYQVAKAHQAEDQWSDDLAVAAAVAADSHTHAFLNDPRISQEQLVAMHLPPGAKADGLFAHFLQELAHFRRLALLPDVAHAYAALKRAAEARTRIKVTSAKALDPAETDTLKQALARRFGGAVDMDVSVDPALLGGVILDTGKAVIDGSVRGRLQKLATALAH